MTYWADNKINVVADMPEPVFRVFTNANIVGGKPTYSSGSTQNRYTQALVSYTDVDNHSNDAIEPVVNLKLQRRYKTVRKVDLSAIGCTRQSEAHRRGDWVLLTNENDRMVSFSTGLEGDTFSRSCYWISRFGFCWASNWRSSLICCRA